MGCGRSWYTYTTGVSSLSVVDVMSFTICHCSVTTIPLNCCLESTASFVMQSPKFHDDNIENLLEGLQIENGQQINETLMRLNVTLISQLAQMESIDLEFYGIPSEIAFKLVNEAKQVIEDSLFIRLANNFFMTRVVFILSSLFTFLFLFLLKTKMAN